jgi:molecular chaperone DnaK (HSP70)
VKTIQVGEVLKRIISPDSNLVLVADFGESAFRVTLQEKTKCLYQNANSTLGFSSFDMLSLIDCDDASSHSSIEIALLGQMMQRIKIMANNGGEVVLPNNISAKGNSLSSSFEQKMTTFLYQCFEECTNALKTVSKSWKNVEEVVFVGGGAHSNIIDTVFKKYIQSHGTTLVSYNSKNIGFDAQYATTNCAIQMPEIENKGDVTVTRGTNYV